MNNISEEIKNLIAPMASDAADELMDMARGSMVFNDADAAGVFVLAEYSKNKFIPGCPEIIRGDYECGLYEDMPELIEKIIEEESYETDVDSVFAAFSNVQEIGDAYFDSIEEDIIDITGDPNGPFEFGYLDDDLSPFRYFWGIVYKNLAQQL